MVELVHFFFGGGNGNSLMSIWTGWPIFFLQSFHSAGKFQCGSTRHQDDPEVVQKATSTNLDVVLEVRING